MVLVSADTCEVTLNQSSVEDINLAVAVYVSSLGNDIAEHLSVITLDQSSVGRVNYTVAVYIAEDVRGNLFAPADGHLSAGLGVKVEVGQVELHLDGGACGQTCDLEVLGTVVDRVGLYAISDNAVVAEAEVVGPCVVDCELELYVAGIILAKSISDNLNAVHNL